MNASPQQPLSRLAANTGWSLADRILRLVALGLVMILLARWLGPKLFGTLAYGLAFVKLATVLVELGLNRIVVMHLVEAPARGASLLRYSVGCQLLAACLVFPGAIGLAWLWTSGDSTVVTIVAMAGLSLFFQPARLFLAAFEASMAYKWIFLTGMVALLVSATGKLAVAWSAPAWLPMIAAFETVEAALLAVVAVAFFRRHMASKYGPVKHVLTQRGRAPVDLWVSALPLFVTMLAVTVYSRIDEIMLGALRSEQELGVYVAAVQLSEVWAFIPMAVIPAVFPFLLRTRQETPAIYAKRLQFLFQGMALLAGAIIVVIWLIAPLLISLLYGTAYTDAAIVLRIHILALIPIFFGLVQGAWDTAERRLWWRATRACIGAGINIALNLWWIPLYGPMGAAAATVCSYGIAGILLNALHPATRPILGMEIRSLMLMPLYSSLDRKKWRHFCAECATSILRHAKNSPQGPG